MRVISGLALAAAVMLLAPTSVMAAEQAKPKPGAACQKKGVTSGDYVCTSRKGKLVWVVRSSTSPVTTKSCTARTVPSGKAAGSNELQPGGQRLRSATSPDGIVWTRNSDTIVDQAATPSLTRTSDGRPMLFMTANQVAGGRDGFAVALGTANGLSWTQCSVQLVGFPAGLSAVDPDVVALPGGGYRVFLTGSIGNGSDRIGIHYADSPDGFVWTYGGVAFSPVASVLDSMTFRLGDIWHMYVLNQTSMAMFHATSADGKSFVQQDESERKVDGKAQVLSQGLMVGDQMRIYGFGSPGQTRGGWEIRSFVTADGTTLIGDSRLLLSITGAPSSESVFVKDPAVTQLADGTYLMVYSTVIP